MKSNIATVVLVVVVLIIVGVFLVLRNQEIGVRAQSQSVYEQLTESLDGTDALTPDQVQQIAGHAPVDTRVPGNHRMVEEYHWSGPFDTYKVFAYYQTGSTKLLEAASLNQTLADWEAPDDP